MHIGTAGWSIPREHAGEFSCQGSGLVKYTSRLGAVEINSTFWRRHRRSTFERWRDSVPKSFRFAVKVPRAITHEAALVSPAEALREFLDDVSALGTKLGPVLVQLPPSLEFNVRRARSFFRELRRQYLGAVACEPRHSGWYQPAATAMLLDYEIARVVADPPRPDAARFPAGAPSLRYVRWHGSPHIYRSPYGDGRLGPLAATLLDAPADASVWCIFDNTASGAATGDALLLKELIARGARSAQVGVA
jgi:uncharacterized protein YecE (DUF72 family)